jgi:hypothetical protein
MGNPDKKKKGFGILTKLFIIAVLVVVLIHLTVRFFGVEALKGADVIGMLLTAVGYGG